MFEVMAYSLSCERFVRKPSDEVKMDMRDGLARHPSDVPSDIVALWPFLIE